MKLDELNKFTINIIDKLIKKEINIRQIIFCLLKKDYSMINIKNYDNESWNYNGIVYYEIKNYIIIYQYYLKFRIYTDGSKFWYCNNELHNDDVDENNNLIPAVIDENGNYYYYIDGVDIDIEI